MKIKVRSLVSLVYIILMTYSLFYRIFGIEQPIMKQYFCGILIVFLYLIIGHGRDTKQFQRRAIRYLAKIYLFPYLFILIWSYIIIIINSEGFRYVTRATANTIYLCLAVIVGVSSFFLFGRKAFDLFWYSAIICFSFNIVTGIARFGFAAVPSYFNDVTLKPNEITIIHYFEQHELILMFGLFFLYYLLISKDEDPKKNIKALISLGFVAVGFKRIVFVALAVLLVVVLIARRLIRKNNGRTVYILIDVTTIIVLVAVFVWLYAIHSGLLQVIAGYYQVDFMGRFRMYSFFNGSYTLSPTFIGLGIGATEKLMAASGQFVGSSVHSDILRNYIEYGCVPFVIWCWYYLNFFAKKLRENRNIRIVVIFFVLMLYTFILAFTDNVFRYYHFQMLLFMIIIKNYLDLTEQQNV